MRYIGEKCPVCQKEFTAEDDIVVCPECGTPHHRECYMLANRCANEELHAAGEKWKHRAKPSRYRVCPKCSFPNRITDTACQRCGEELSAAYEQTADNSGTNGEKHWGETFTMPDAEELMNPIKYLGLDPNEDMGGVTMK
ncbi:RING finger protein [Ruminococcus sp.]